MYFLTYARHFSYVVLQRKHATEGKTGATCFPFLITQMSSFLLPALSLRNNTEILSKYVTAEYRNIPGKSLTAYKMSPDLIRLVRHFPKG